MDRGSSALLAKNKPKLNKYKLYFLFFPGTALTTASGMSTVKSKNTMKAGLAVETMSAPNPFCPNTRGVCCLMVLANLALILVCIGFIIVLQLTDPPVIWNIGIVILVFGFVTLFITLIYCMCICQETNTHK